MVATLADGSSNAADWHTPLKPLPAAATPGAPAFVSLAAAAPPAAATDGTLRLRGYLGSGKVWLTRRTRVCQTVVRLPSQYPVDAALCLLPCTATADNMGDGLCAAEGPACPMGDVSSCQQPPALVGWDKGGLTTGAGENRTRAIHIIQPVQCTVGVRVTVQALPRQFPSLLHRRSCPWTLPFLPGLGVGCPLAVLCQPCFVSASAVLTAIKYLLALVHQWSETVWT